MSLNGDIMVMRNGRSTSQVSIYNYPEHLNPFYEDEQHKRLRFWHINKKGRHSEEGRRNSFSMSGLKDMWAFKSFRLGKKRSSTLGINKTSESPPPLRRDYEYANGNGNGGCNTYDPRMRHSSNAPNGNEFQRNAGYRSSLQNMHTTTDTSGALGFGRNDQYRSTIQFAGNRYAGGGTQSASITPQQPRRYASSLTPQPVRSGANEYGVREGVLLRGSSQCSVSTNPFETDNEYDDDDNEHERENTPFPGELNESNASSAAKKRTPRKKRRAPPVPVPVHKNNLNESSQSHGAATEAEAEQQQQQLRIVESQEISNLTAEIESFVNASNVSADHLGEESTINTTTTTTTTTSGSARHSVTSPSVTFAAISNSNSTNKQPTATTTTTAATITTVAPRDQWTSEVATPPVPVTAPKTANGAIPKESNSSSSATTYTQDDRELPSLKIEENIELRIAEKGREKEREAPTPQQRNKVAIAANTATTTTTTTGHVECIHVHIDENRHETPVAPEATSRVTSFKPLVSPRSQEAQQITTKTSFTLVNPPTNATTATTTTTNTIIPTNELHISEAQGVERRAKPTLAAKPAHVPQINITAEVHKPNRRSRPISGDESPNTPKATPTQAEQAVPAKVSEHKAVRIAEPEATTHEVARTPPIGPSEIDAPPPVELLTTKRSITESVREVSFTPSTATILAPSGAPSVASTPAPLRIVESRESLQLREPRAGFDERFCVPKPRSLLDWKQSTLAPLETNLPPEKRKSVKDIIESINRSQRLLQAAAHKDLTLSDSEMNEARLRGTMTPVMPRKFSEPNNNFDDHRQPPMQSPRKISSNPSLAAGGGAGASTGSGTLHDDSDDDDDIYDDGAQKPNNAEIFKKCRVNKEVYDYRETSPTASNLDWNPLPKPKRTKNMPDI